MKKQERSLQSSHEQESVILRTLVDNLPDGVFLKDTKSRFVFANHVISHLMGAPEPSALIGRTDHDYFPKEVADAFLADERTVIESRQPVVNREESESKSGKFRWLTTKVPLVDAHGEVTGVLGITRDITVRHEAEAELKISEERYRSLFENMLNGFAYCRMIFENGQPRDFIYLGVNAAFETLTGLRHVVGKKVTEVIPGIRDTNPELFEVYGRVSLTGKPEKLETFVPELDIWFSISVYCPEKEHFIAVFENITDRKRLQDSLEQERTLFLALINSLHDQISVKDREGRFVVANPSEAHFKGVEDPAHLVGKTEHDFHERALADKLRSDERRVTEDGISVVDLEESKKSAKGELRWFLTTKIPFRDPSGAIMGLVSSSHDITQRRQAGDKQREQAALLDIATDAILVRDMNSRIVYWNKSSATIYGWRLEEALGQEADRLLFSPARAAEPENAVAIVKEKGEWNGEVHQQSKEGRELTIETRWTLLRGSEGTPTGILCVNTDVTERRAVQSQLLRAQRLESLGTLAGGIAHDLNNVLSPIIMGVEGLGLYCPDTRAATILGIIRTAAQRGASIVHQVLSFARGKEGERTEVQLKHIIREVGQIMEETFPKSIETRIEVPKDLPAVVADSTQIHQVLMNLCVNARDSMPNGGRLGLSAEAVHLDETYSRMHVEAQPIDYVVLKVEDTGHGIPPGLVEKIFEPFFTTKEVGKGTGLGLSVTRTIVKSHGGFINLYSEPGRGSSFKVYLPTAHPVPERTETASEGIPMGEDELILVIDDEAAVREIARQILESYGYRVVTASDGAEAMAIYMQRRGEIQAVVTDMAMPYMDGAATARALRKINPGVKIVATSGLLAVGQSKKMIELGIQEFLAKPYTAESLLAALRRVLDAPPP
jgi:two-component system cell cycle sensor histidine kinase/response regulator CckA